MNAFGRRVGVEFFGDEAALEKSFANVAASTKAYGDLSVSTSEKTAKARVLATATSIKALREDVAFFRAATESQVKGTDLQIASANRLAAAQKRLAAVTGVVTRESTAATAAFAGSTRTAERDFGKTTRGVLAGSSVFRGLGRSLAFASSGFIAVAVGATLIRSSITAAETLAKAQESLSVAIKHTHGDLAKLRPEYEATAKAAAQFGVSQVDATTGLARATVLTGNASAAQRAYQEALLISKATGKDFNVVLTATAKGQEGITTSLRHYGILVKKGESGTQQFTQVMERFGGQARANTTSTDRLRAVFANTEAVIGKALLPTFERLAGSLAAWLEKMNRTGQLQKDVNEIIHTAGDVFHTFGHVIGVVDKATGGFKHTLEILAAFKFASLIGGWIGSLKTLAIEWGLVKTAAAEAAAAETVAGAGAGAGVAGAAGRAAAGGGGAVVAGRFAGRAAAIEAAAPFAPFLAIPAIASLAHVHGPKNLKILGYTSEGQPIALGSDGKYYAIGARGYVQVSKSLIASFASVPGKPVITEGLRNFGLGRGGSVAAPFLPSIFQRPVAAPNQGPFGAAQPIPVYKTFSLTPAETITQAQVALTRSNADDVAAARRVVARIKRLIDEGHLAGKSLIQALQAEASALGTIWSAEDAAAQKRAAAAQAAKQRIQTQLENSIDPLKLEVALSRAQALGKPLIPYLKALRAAAEKALATGKLSLTQQKEAYDQIASLNQQIASAATTAIKTFTAAPKLQLALAKDAALGRSDTKDLLKLKAAILKFIRTHKKNIQAEIDAYNQLAQVNQQLGSTAQSALGLFKQASTKALTAGLGLTAAQRKALRERLSQLGPGGTVPGQGTGAYGYAIGSDGRPIVVHTHVNLDGKRVANNTTRHQHRHRRRNPSQRRGPNAATS